MLYPYQLSKNHQSFVFKITKLLYFHIQEIKFNYFPHHLLHQYNRHPNMNIIL